MGIIRKSFRRQTEMEYLLAHGMKIGNNCHIYSDSTIDHTYPHLISIGNNVTISTNVTILAHDASTNVVEGGDETGESVHREQCFYRNRFHHPLRHAYRK